MFRVFIVTVQTATTQSASVTPVATAAAAVPVVVVRQYKLNPIQAKVHGKVTKNTTPESVKPTLGLPYLKRHNILLLL